MQKHIIKIFKLQGLLVGKLEYSEDQKQILINVRSPRRMAKCIHCKNSSKRVHQIKTRLVKHAIVDDKIVVLIIKYRRFKCHKCGKLFTEVFPGIDRKCTTMNFRLQLLNWLQRNSFAFIGAKFNIAPSTLVRYLLEINKEINISWSQLNITKLGIDEHSFRGKRMVITITDLSNKKLLTVLKGDSQIYLINFLVSIPPEFREKINEVCTDLRYSYRSVINKYLPQAMHTADRFHVEQLARIALDNIRQVIQEVGQGRKMNMKKLLWINKNKLNENELKRLDYIFKKYSKFPILKQSWIIKEHIIKMYHASTLKEAEKRFEHIIMLLQTPDHTKYLVTLKNTLKKWKVPILNYFKNKTTNGFTEGCHTKIKMIKRVSFGFRNINNYIAKITLAFLPLIWIVNYHTY